MEVGDLVKYTDEANDLGIGMIIEKRKQGGYWAYFVEVDEWYPITSSAWWEVIA